MKAIVGKEGLDDLPVVVVSAFSECLEIGAKRVLKKPLDVRKLLAAVAEYCCCSPLPPHTRN